MNVVDVVFTSPELLAALTVALYLLSAWQRTLSYREYRAFNWIRVRYFALMDPVAQKAGRALLAVKQPPEQDGEFVTHRDATVRETFAALTDAGFSPHLLATVKVREGRDGREFAAAQLVFTEASDTDDYRRKPLQTEAYLFATDDGVDVYAHVEAAVTSPRAHLQAGQGQGDTRGHVADALA